MPTTEQLRRSREIASAGLLPVFVTLALILGLSGLSIFLIARATARANGAVSFEQHVIDDLRQSLSTMKDAETGHRGFVLTGEESYLAPNTDARNRIGKELDNLEALAASGFLEGQDVAKYQELVRAKMQEMDGIIAVRRSQGLVAAVALVQQDKGKQIMDDLRQLTDRMIERSHIIMREKLDSATSLGEMTDGVFAAIILINLAFLGWAYRRIKKEIDLRTRATLDAQREHELLRVTLGSIGDGVIVTDAQSRITFLNGMAETLTGWPLADADGRPCQEIFRIINETSRLPVESPVEKVIHQGCIVGLANHTLLIARDGREIPIDDSGAPILESDGKLRGVVLVFRDFSEHKQAEHALRLAMEDAQAANIAKDNFLATLSHELRTPLTPVVMTLASWVGAPSLPETWREDVEMMRRNLDLEARLIDDLLDLTRIVRGKLSLNFILADVNGLLDSVARMYQSEVLTKGLRLSLDLKADHHHVFVDPARLQQVFLNVFKNATKFTPEGGRIEVRTENNKEGLLHIHIRDSGIGMSAEVLSRLFRPFEQGTDEMVRRYGGLGLGMAISKALLEVQGGAIAAVSEGAGQGSTFSVTLPAVEACMLDEAKPDQGGSEPTRHLEVLLVEDHEDTARALKRLLERWGHTVTCVNTVAGALEAARAGGFDLMLSDIGLPDGTGIELIKKIRTFSQMAAIALSGFGMEEDVSSCREAGFNEHLTKPINFQRLETIIRQVLREG